jgi:hypothetical protein
MSARSSSSSTQLASSDLRPFLIHPLGEGLDRETGPDGGVDDVSDAPSVVHKDVVLGPDLGIRVVARLSFDDAASLVRPFEGRRIDELHEERHRMTLQEDEMTAET